MNLWSFFLWGLSFFHSPFSGSLKYMGIIGDLNSYYFSMILITEPIPISGMGFSSQ